MATFRVVIEIEVSDDVGANRDSVRDAVEQGLEAMMDEPAAWSPTGECGDHVETGLDFNVISVRRARS